MSGMRKRRNAAIIVHRDLRKCLPELPVPIEGHTAHPEDATVLQYIVQDPAVVTAQLRGSFQTGVPRFLVHWRHMLGLHAEHLPAILAVFSINWSSYNYIYMVL